MRNATSTWAVRVMVTSTWWFRQTETALTDGSRTSNMEETRGALSLAQVEEELRSAEAYLTASEAPPAPVETSYAVLQGQAHALSLTERTPRNDIEDLRFRRKLKTRPVLSEERRREILAKLSTERQEALRARRVGVETEGDRETTGVLQENWAVGVSEEKKYQTPEEREELIQKLLSDRNFSRLESEGGEEGAEYPALSPSQRTDSGLSSESSEDEIYYASDILGDALSDDVQPRSKLDFIFEGKEEPDTTSHAEQFQTSTTVVREPTPLNDSAMQEGQEVGPPPSSLFAKLLAQVSTGQDRAPEQAFDSGVENEFLDESQKYADIKDAHRNTSLPNKLPWQETHQLDEALSTQQAETSDDQLFSDMHSTARQTERINPYEAVLKKKPSSRIDFLAQPRNQTFAEREKLRLLLEMQQLRECTFQPNVLKPPTTTTKTRAKSTLDLSCRPGTTAFQWLTLSPRQKKSRRADDVDATEDGLKEAGSQNVIQRLHLDGASRYDSRECAREALEAHKLQECTFKPRINAASKAMFSMVDYKPIHHRVSDLQRAKAEYVERIREQLDLEECGPLSFTPSINPKSREIASNKLAIREAEEFNQFNIGKPKSHNVTERLAEDAEAIAERRQATQEYFDMLNEQPFAPTISETSRKIVEQKPEFKMDFVTRQQYFQSRDQEKMEALEVFCDMDYARGERLTFKPDIGNANGVLKQMRPDRSAESSQQKLYRLTYNDQRQAELKKQRLREEQYAQYTFKPEINPVSKALGRSSTLDELAHPVRDIQQTPPPSKRSPPQERKSESSASRVALRQYFASKRFRSRVALEMEEASKAECTFQPNLVASRKPGGSTSTTKLYSRDPRSRTKLEWQSENLLHLIEAERQKKTDEIEAKRNAQELKELEECTFHPKIHRPGRGRKASSAKGSPSPPRDGDAEEKPVIVRGLGRFLELRDLARKQQAEQKQREQKVFAPNTNYEPRSYTVPKPFKLSERSKDSIRRRLKVREEMRAKEGQECTFRPQTVSSQSRRVLQNMLSN